MIEQQKINALCDKITQQQQARLKAQKLDCQCNMDLAICHFHIAKKYTRIDIGSSGRYMIDNNTGEIFGIKAYGVIHRGHYFGTLDTINDYFWGNYKAEKI
jgi:hypothetical protein